MKKIVFILSLISILCIMFLVSCDFKEELIIKINSGVDTVEVFSSFEDKGATAYYGSSIVAVRTESDVDTSHVGEYTVTYTATYNGETVKATRKVTIVDQTAPSIFLNPGIDTITVGGEWVDAGVTTTDNSNEEVIVKVEGNVDTNKVGEYIITYHATDKYNNSSSIIRYVNVVANE